MKKTVPIIIVILIAIVGGYFLLRGGYQVPTTPTTTPTTPEVSVPEEEGVSGPEVKEITVVGTEFSFSPSVITIQAGQKVKITFENIGGAPHNWIIQGLEIGTKTIGGGKTDTIEFTAPSSGTYTLFCSVSGHRAAGMEGSLKVE